MSPCGNISATYDFVGVTLPLQLRSCFNVGVWQPLGSENKAVKGGVVLLCHCEARLILSQRGNLAEAPMDLLQARTVISK